MKKHYNIRDSYKLYSKEQNPVDATTYVDINKEFMKFLMRKCFEDGIVNIPERLGTLQINGKKPTVKYIDGNIKGLLPDWKSTKELWERDPIAKENKQLVYHFNEETNGIRYSFFWSKARVLVPNKTLYNLRLTRTNKRILAALIKQGKEYLIK